MYSKKDAVMTHGFAIICMLVLHLFCRFSDSSMGTHLIWITDEKSLAYYFGFFAEICVPLYAITAGYPQQLMIENGKYNYKSNLIRAFKLVVKYWIVLCVFSVIGLIVNSNDIPISFKDFVLNVFLIKRYNGAWWFMLTYILLMIIPPKFVLHIVNKINNMWLSLAGCFALFVIIYLVDRTGIYTRFESNAILNWILYQIDGYLTVIPYFILGGIICKYKIIDRTDNFLNTKFSKKHKNIVLLLYWFITSLIIVILNKAALNFLSALSSFIVFNLIDRPKFLDKILLHLGNNNTYMWLTHMFFYSVLFRDLVVIAKYPLFMFGFLLILSLLSSYVLTAIEKALYKIYGLIKNKKA